MKKHQWEVWCELIDDDERRIYTTVGPHDAAALWASERGHDVDDEPLVYVRGPLGEDGCMVFLFQLHADIKWRWTRLKHP